MRIEAIWRYPVKTLVGEIAAGGEVRPVRGRAGAPSWAFGEQANRWAPRDGARATRRLRHRPSGLRDSQSPSGPRHSRARRQSQRPAPGSHPRGRRDRRGRSRRDGRGGRPLRFHREYHRVRLVENGDRRFADRAAIEKGRAARAWRRTRSPRTRDSARRSASSGDRVDSRRIEGAFAMEPTPIDVAIERTVSWYTEVHRRREQ